MARRRDFVGHNDIMSEGKIVVLFDRILNGANDVLELGI